MDIDQAAPGAAAAPGAKNKEAELADINAAIQATQIDMALHQIADAALARIENIYSRLAHSEGADPSEAAALCAEAASIAEATEFNSEKIFQAEFQVPFISPGFSPADISAAAERVALMRSEIAGALVVISSAQDRFRARLNALTSFRPGISDAEREAEIARITGDLQKGRTADLEGGPRG